MFVKKKTIGNDIKESTFSCQKGNLIIRGTEFRPKGKNLPIAIVSHGLNEGQNGVKKYAHFLAERGYAAYCFDFCGGMAEKCESDGETTAMTVLTEVEDLETVMEYAKSQPYVNSKRMLLMGCSQGGYVSAYVAAKHNSEIEQLILFFPAFCIADMIEAGNLLGTKFNRRKAPDEMKCAGMLLGRCYLEDAYDIDIYEEIKGFDGDVLIVHGSKDKNVDISYSEKAYETYLGVESKREEPREVLFRIVEKGKHGFDGKYAEMAMEYMKEVV
ncbi:MAG: alpha/beta hydrolase [Lachnospiraceae bacterium]|nr:alpha/beta hydrolase [Lachnospiraceae bacterium]